MEDFISGKTGSGKPSSINVPDPLNVDAASLTLVSVKELELGFNPLAPFPAPLSIEDAKALTESLVARTDREPDLKPPMKADGIPDEV